MLIKKRKRREKEKGVRWKKKRKNEGEEEAKKMLLHRRLSQKMEGPRKQGQVCVLLQRGWEVR